MVKEVIHIGRVISIPRVISIILLGCLTIGGIQAQYRRPQSGSADDNYHFLYVSGGAGYNTMLTNDRQITSKGSVGGLIGLGYEFRLNGFWMSVGPQLSFSNSNLSISKQSWRPCEDTNSPYYGQMAYDENGREIHPEYQVYQTDEVRWSFIDIPILLGYYTHGFYLGTGAKFSYAINSNVKSVGTYDFIPHYELYIDMPQGVHGYKQYQFDSRAEKIETTPSISLLGEIGYDVLSSVTQRGQICHVLKVGFYMEYGLSSIIKGSVMDNRYEFQTKDRDGNYDLRYLTVHPYFQGKMDNRRVVPLYTGMKITYLIGGSRNARSGFHKGCQCYN